MVDWVLMDQPQPSTRPPQFYGLLGVPMRIEREVGTPALAWRAHRERLRRWVEALPDEEWGARTRCGEWDVSALVRHLVSGSQFLGYTLHEASRGKATTLLRNFDAQATAREAAAMLGEFTPEQARQNLAAMDASVDTELLAVEETDWWAMAEAPLGNVPAHLAVNHFLFDSWVHEYDLMIPRGERPLMTQTEVETVVPYLVALVLVGTGSTTGLDVRVVDADLRIGARLVDGVTLVEVGSAPTGAPVLEGAVLDIVDRATGRVGGMVEGDERALAVLDRGGRMMSG